MNRPPTCADVRQTGCRGRQPLRSDLASPERGGVAGACAGDGGVSPPSPPCHCEPVTDVTGVAIRVPRPRRGRRPRRPASFVLRSRRTDSHASVRRWFAMTGLRPVRSAAPTCAPRRGGACLSHRLFLPQRGRMSLATGEGESFPSPRRGDSRIARRHAPMSDKRAVEGASPYAATLPPLKGEVSPALAPVTEGCLPRPHRVIANQ